MASYGVTLTLHYVWEKVVLRPAIRGSVWLHAGSVRISPGSAWLSRKPVLAWRRSVWAGDKSITPVCDRCLNSFHLLTIKVSSGGGLGFLQTTRVPFWIVYETREQPVFFYSGPWHRPMSLLSRVDREFYVP